MRVEPSSGHCEELQQMHNVQEILLFTLRDNIIAYRRRFGGFVKLIGIMREPETISYTFRILMRRVSFIGDDHRNNSETIVSHNTHN